MILPTPLLSVLALLVFAATATTASSPATTRTTPAKREYHSHTYYVLELDAPSSLHSTSSPSLYPSGSSRERDDYDARAQQVAEALGAELVEQVGELRGHYLVRAPIEVVQRGDEDWNTEVRPMLWERSLVGRGESLATGQGERDAIMERYEMLRKRSSGTSNGLRARAAGSATLDIRNAVRSLERQYLRKRVKRDSTLLQTTYDPSSTLQRRGSPFDPRQDAPQTTKSLVQQMAERFQILDPIFDKQWHLVNDVIEQNSINVTGVWAEGVYGKGVNVAIVDDGLDMHSDDLAANFHAEGSWDYNDHTALPEPRLSDDQHGTRCAGEIAAGKNEVCGVGVAYEAGIAGIRILSASISDADEAAALNYGYQSNAIYSCSWGPPDDGKSMEAPGYLILKAMLNGVQNGRGGKGSIFVFASGNGGGSDDQCNFDGYTNSLMSITVGAIDRLGLHPYYSEACSAIMVVTYSSGSGDNIHTTDVGKDACTDRHGGTSAAAPIAAGIFALVLEVRPDLSWRDLQHLCVQTAVQVNPKDPDWQMTASGRNFNHKYGFGKLDAWAMVNAARSYTLAKPQAWWVSPRSLSGDKITPDGVTAQMVVTKADLVEANFETLEHITITVHIEHERRGNVEVELDSPRGMKSILARPRKFDDATTGLPNWVFMTVKHWDEDPIGTWTLRVRDRQTNNMNGTFLSWSMQLWGASIDPSKAVPWEIPSDYRDQNNQPSPYETSAVVSEITSATTSALPPSKTYNKPTAHLPEDHAEASGEAHLSFGQAPSPAPTANPSPLPTPVDHAVEDEVDSNGEEADGDDFSEDLNQSGSGYLKGMSTLLHSSTWLFVAAGTIVVFIGVVTAYFWLRGRRLSKLMGGGRRGAGYDFAPVEDEDDNGMPMSAMERGRLRLLGRGADGTTRSTPRTKDLYDAFALDPDSEDEDENEHRPDDDHDRDGTGGVGASGGRREVREDVAYTDEAMDSFLDDDGPEGHSSGEGAGGSASGSQQKTEKKSPEAGALLFDQME